MKIPFDSVTLAAVVHECRPLVGGRLERIVQWDAYTIGLGVYHGSESWLLVSCDPVYPRTHLVSLRREGLKPPPPFCLALRKHLTDATLTGVSQRGLDRIVEVRFQSPTGRWTLIAEIMGKHSNIVLCDGASKILASAKVVGLGKSKRPIVPGRTYVPPPFEPRPTLLDATPGDDLAQYEGASPFLRSLIQGGTALGLVQEALRENSWTPCYAHGLGAYPLNIGPPSVERRSISQALEEHYGFVIERDKATALKANLTAQLKRVYEARQRSLARIQDALDSASTARTRQEQAELILAYQGQIKAGDASVTVPGYDGSEVTIKLSPTLTPLQNAQRLFEKAKRAKEGAADVARSRANIERDFAALNTTLERLAQAETVTQLIEIKEEADRHRWLHHQVQTRTKEERPYEGHSIREAVSPNGWKILYGENATSNDYLTTKVARPNDYWLHVRGATSAHVVLLTQNRPLSVQKEDLAFAAQIAVDKSASKHSSYVTVDCTLKKYVRKPRKSAPGAVTYSNEKTIHIER